VTVSQTRFGQVEFSVDGPVARVVIDRPGTMNALGPEVLAGLSAAADAAEAAGCTIFVISGVAGVLSSGADLTYLRSVLADESQLRSYIESIGHALDRIEAASFISIAVVPDLALAGGCELLLACDLAVVSADARIGDRHMEYGLIPGAGGSVRMVRGVALPIARRLLLTGEIIDGLTAAQFGLVSHCAPVGELPVVLDGLIARLGRHSPTALVRMKQLVRRANELEPAAALAEERETLLTHLLTDLNAREGLAAFAERRAPRFESASGTIVAVPGEVSDGIG
jgi:enoyl-CoA hydratase/carnithine racemase